MCCGALSRMRRRSDDVLAPAVVVSEMRPRKASRVNFLRVKISLEDITTQLGSSSAGARYELNTILTICMLPDFISGHLILLWPYCLTLYSMN